MGSTPADEGSSRQTDVFVFFDSPWILLMSSQLENVVFWRAVSHGAANPCGIHSQSSQYKLGVCGSESSLHPVGEGLLMIHARTARVTTSLPLTSLHTKQSFLYQILSETSKVTFSRQTEESREETVQICDLELYVVSVILGGLNRDRSKEF